MGLLDVQPSGKLCLAYQKTGIIEAVDEFSTDSLKLLSFDPVKVEILCAYIIMCVCLCVIYSDYTDCAAQLLPIRKRWTARRTQQSVLSFAICFNCIIISWFSSDQSEPNNQWRNDVHISWNSVEFRTQADWLVLAEPHTLIFVVSLLSPTSCCSSIHFCLHY